jgi:hypothetical protein
VRAAYCYGGRGHHHHPVADVCRLVRTAAQCGEDFEYGRKAYDGYIKVFWALLAEDGESSPPTSGKFQSANA